MSIWRGETSVTQGLHRHPQHGGDHKSFDIEDDILKIPRGVHAEGACQGPRTVARRRSVCTTPCNRWDFLPVARSAVGAKHVGLGGLFGACAALMLLWLVVAWPMRAPQARQTNSRHMNLSSKWI
jgi:hypothetical protein